MTLANLKKKKMRKAIFRRQKDLAKIEVEKAWRNIFVKAGILQKEETQNERLS